MNEETLNAYLNKACDKEKRIAGLNKLVKLDGKINDVDYYVELSKKYYPKDNNTKYYVYMK